MNCLAFVDALEPATHMRDRQLAEELFAVLKERTGDGIGITRASYGDGETIALGLIEARAKALGLDTERDAAGNLVVTLLGHEPEQPYIACGSHLDSVPQGGNFDGAAGIIAGLLILADFKSIGYRPRRTVKLFCLRGEESARFGKSYIGSSALFGMLTADDLAARSNDDGRSLKECMGDVGVDVDRVERGEPLLDVSRIAAWIELHIEQGPVLVARGEPIGIVTGIRGNVRHRTIECIGEAGQSGAVPRWLRHDAMFATAELITQMDQHWRSMLENGRDIVVTAGVLSTDPQEHAIARIPGTVRFSFEIRSESLETMEAFYALFQSQCQSISDQRGVEFKLDRRVDSAPATMNPKWIARLKEAARQLGIVSAEIASGAGHDAAVFANAGVPTAMIFVRNQHGSHNPKEAMDMSDFLTGVSVMRAAIREAVQ